MDDILILEHLLQVFLLLSLAFSSLAVRLLCRFNSFLMEMGVGWWKEELK